jgi:hypothetical protein
VRFLIFGYRIYVFNLQYLKAKERKMKKLLLISALFLVVMYPSMVLAGDVYSNSKATLYSEPNKLPKAKGDANIVYSSAKHEWTITVNFSGLIRSNDYIFQISAQDQLWIKYDIPIKSDKSGNITNFVTKIQDLDTQIQESGPYMPSGTQYFLPDISYSAYDATHDPVYKGYTILRLLDLSGASGGIKLTSLEPTSATNPFLPAYPKATMVMRAREDGFRAELTFTAP